MTVESLSSAHTLTIRSVLDQPHSVLRVSTIASPRPSGSSAPGATIRGTLNVVPTAFETVRRSRPVPRWRLNSMGGRPCCTAFVTSSDATRTASSGSRHEVSALATMRRATPGAVVSGGRVQLPAGSMVKVYPTAPNFNHQAPIGKVGGSLAGDAPLHRRATIARPSDLLPSPAFSHALLKRQGRLGLRVGPDGYAGVTPEWEALPGAEGR